MSVAVNRAFQALRQAGSRAQLDGELPYGLSRGGFVPLLSPGRRGVAVRKRPLGKTGLVVSELSIGTWGLGGEAYGKVEEADAERVLRRAVDMGFSLIDTADAYGGGRMER